MADQFWITQEDYDGDAQTASIRVKDFEDSVDFPTWEGELSSLNLSILAWTVGRQRQAGYRIVKTDNGIGSASSPVAQGSTQLIMEMQDVVTGGVYRERIPHPDLTKADDVGTNPAWISSGGLTIANPDHADYATMKTRIELSWESPNGNAGTLNRMYIEE